MKNAISALLIGLFSSASLYAMNSNVQIESFDYDKHAKNLLTIHNAVLKLKGHDAPEFFNQKSQMPDDEACDVLCKDNTAVGYIYHQLVVEEESKPVKWVVYLAIDPSESKKGYGKMLLEYVENDARKKQCSVIELKPLENVVGYYKKLGYVERMYVTPTECVKKLTYDSAISNEERIVPFDYHAHREEVLTIHNDVLPQYMPSSWIDKGVRKNSADQCDVLMKNNCIMGYIYHNISKKTKHISFLAVQSQCQKKGYGRMLLEYAENNGRQNGCSIAKLGAEEDAIAFYERMGYKAVSEDADFFEKNLNESNEQAALDEQRKDIKRMKYNDDNEDNDDDDNDDDNGCSDQDNDDDDNEN